MRFHSHYGVPERFPAPIAITPAVYANLASQTPRMRVYLLTNAARDDFHARFPVIGQFGGIPGAGGSDRAWAQHGQSYVMAAWEAYFEAERATQAAELPVSRAA